MPIGWSQIFSDFQCSAVHINNSTLGAVIIPTELCFVRLTVFV